MIDLYGMASPNVTKVVIMLEEIGQPYRYHFVGVMTGENFEPDFLALNPLAKVPVIVDPNGIGEQCPIFESGAILTYLAENYAPQLLPASGPQRWETLKWLTAQVAYAGPMLGQLNHFMTVPDETTSYGGKRYRAQARRVYQVFEQRLADNDWLAGDFFSIADIAFYPWSDYLPRHRFDWSDFPSMAAWRERMMQRPSITRAVEVQREQSAANRDKQAAVTAEDLDRFFQREEGGPPVDLTAMYR